MSSNTDERKITKEDLKKTFFASLPTEWLWNNERQMNDGYLLGMLPVLEKLYPDKKDLSEAMQRHLELFNCTPAIESFPLGISIAQEEMRAKDPENFDTSSIPAVKAALMGPLSGVGDAFFLGTLRIIGLGVGLSLAQKGSLLGPLAFLLIYNIPHYLIRYKGLFFGYELGTKAVSELNSSGMLKKIISAATIVGLLVIGAMTAEMMWASISVTVGSGEAAMSVTDILDGIIPGLTPLLFVGLTNFLFDKKWSPIAVMGLFFAIGLVAAVTGIMA